MTRRAKHGLRQLTLRGLPADLQERLQRLAERENLSLNQAVIRLARSGAGLDATANADVIGDSLDRFIGTWSAKDVRQMERAVELLDEMDSAAR
jgi:hypothetical protein